MTGGPAHGPRFSTSELDSRLDGRWLVLAWPAGSTPARGLPAPWRHLLPDRGPSNGERVHVLIVEDDAAMAEMYRIQLEVDGYGVRVVGTVEEALAAIDRRRPDLVLLDVLLPGRDGFSLLEALRPAATRTPVVILSNYGESAMVDRGLALGALDYFVKSRVTPDAVSRSIPDWLRRAGGP